ncbi:uncharacterized protein LOC106081807 [Stomoxys calcitrans]|uniref:uncharacterized protein LOC106081807 n=1 Tax=Stomoxys calcitrans TaxID=35570 RepID=UPI0027E32992|nr:uncharacterized protein LOC106081807 [Stomoxys calcitrans]
MRAFIFLYFVAVACADQLGYNYQPVGHSNSGLSFAPGAGGSLQGSLGGASSLGASGQAPSFGNGFGSLDTSSGLKDSGSNLDDVDGDFQKEFFTFSANDEDFNEPNADEQIASNLKQSLRVVFIKGPESNGLEDAALALAKQASNQETAIYVLNKQVDLAELANKLNAVSSNGNNKPEVHFVKYRTAEDADNAQKAIQGQYDTLAGKSQSVDGGVAPVINFASQASVPTAASTTAPPSSYLPASIFRRYRS